MVGKPGSGFAFLDAGDTVRRLGVDRLTLDRWVKEGRLRAHRGMGRDVFFRLRDIDELYKELHPDSAVAEALAEEEQEQEQENATESATITRKKQHDPQMRVYLRLQADAKWYDIAPEDIQEWAQQVEVERCERHLSNVRQAIDKLRYLSDQIEATQQREKKQQ